jgi:hypothetical protein
MYKNTRMLIPAALAAGAFLLTACDGGATAAQSTPSSTTSSTAGDATGAATPGDSPEGESTGGNGSGKDCGNTALNNGPTLRLVPDNGAAGYATCDQVRAVWDEFNSIAEKGQIPAEGVTVDSDWQCVPKIENGDPVSAECFTPAAPDANNPAELKFHAEPVL